MEGVRSTEALGLMPDRRGKVRDIFDLGDRLLIVATDRISAYDVVMDEVVPGRGIVLTAMTLAWLGRFPEIPNAVITAEPASFPPPFAAQAHGLAGRSLLVRKADPLPIECIVRGYLSGSGWRSYQQDGSVCGIRLPAGLLRSQRLPEPLFTPSTKAAVGHDENIAYEDVVARLGESAATQVRELSLRLYREGAAHAESRGVIVADTKFEFGLVDGRLVLIDEVLTPDSSRFWPAAEHRPGQEPPSWDKQILRNYLDTLDWNHQPPPPPVAASVLAGTASRYREVLEILFPGEAARWHLMLS
jgi:phosphoribosylaminoimidazole-succinocarboxamide synthase